MVNITFVDSTVRVLFQIVSFSLVNFVTRPLLAVCFFVLPACGVGDEREISPDTSFLDTQTPSNNLQEVVGTNCKAESFLAPDGRVRYRSTYYDILSDGSEIMRSVSETEKPCA